MSGVLTVWGPFTASAGVPTATGTINVVWTATGPTDGRGEPPAPVPAPVPPPGPRPAPGVYATPPN